MTEMMTQVLITSILQEAIREVDMNIHLNKLHINSTEKKINGLALLVFFSFLYCFIVNKD